MVDYKRMYYELAVKTADAVDILIEAQQKCEEIFLESSDDASFPE